jgi:hypothetical protein
VAKTKKTTRSSQASSAKGASTANAAPAAVKAAVKKSAGRQDTAATTTLNRRGGRDRRKGADRRSTDQPVAMERRKVQRRAKVNRRRQIDPTTCERDYTLDEIEFMSAMDEYKRTSGRMFPTCSEVLEVIRTLGYEKHPQDRAADRPAPEPAGNSSAN